MRSKVLEVLSFLVVATLLASCGGGSSGNDNSAVTVNSGLAIGSFPGGITELNGLAFFAVDESEQGGIDLNGDLDAADKVLHFLDPMTGVVTNVGHAVTGDLVVNDNVVGWALPEISDGGIDRNADGDAGDIVLAWFDPTLPMSPTNPRITSVVVGSQPFILGNGEFFIYVVSEADLVLDVNGDVDLMDQTVAFMNTTTAVQSNLGFAISIDIPLDFDRGVLVFAVSEEDHSVPTGSMTLGDLNLDGDASDDILFVYVASTGMTLPVGPGAGRAVAGRAFVAGTIADPYIIYGIDESGESLNLNTAFSGDTDLQDTAAAVFRVNTMTETLIGGGVGCDAGRFFGSATRGVISVPESDNGDFGVDLNLDGDANDNVPFWFDLASPAQARNVGIAQGTDLTNTLPVVCGETMLFFAREVDQGPNGTNYNAERNDTDTTDTVAFFLNLSAPGIPAVNLAYAANQVVCLPDDPTFFVVVAQENDNGGSDLNFDGNNADDASIYFPVANGNISGPGQPLPIAGNIVTQPCGNIVRFISFVAENEDEFFMDRNEDLDNNDFICFSVAVSRSTGGFLGEAVLGTVDPLVAPNGFPVKIGDRCVIFVRDEVSQAPAGSLNVVASDTDQADHILFYTVFDCF